MGLKKELLEILVCPKCKGELEYKVKGGKESLICKRCRLSYPVRDGIPIMLIEEAEKIEQVREGE